MNSLNRKKGPQGPKRPKPQFLEYYSDPDPRSLPRTPDDYYLRKCATIAATRGETFAEYKAAWEGRREDNWWLRRYREKPESEPQFTDEQVAAAYADALAANLASTVDSSFGRDF